jgi:hypothetical protein
MEREATVCDMQANGGYRDFTIQLRMAGMRVGRRLAAYRWAIPRTGQSAVGPGSAICRNRTNGKFRVATAARRMTDMRSAGERQLIADPSRDLAGRKRPRPRRCKL